MVDILKIQRRNTAGECGEHVGNMVLKIENIPDFKTVQFLCTKTPGHRDECAFEGKDLVVRRRQGGIILGRS